jgi:hypothetical protein
MEKARVEGARKYKGVGVMKDKEVNLEKISEWTTLNFYKWFLKLFRIFMSREGLLRWLKFIINR